ncbi:MAG TPA: hypothetical protein VK558_11610 [Patescibacteria group bacterium]|nr:hypothetical protein [Patescibacteria group bacterium]
MNKSNAPRRRPSAAFLYALRMVERMGGNDFVLVPVIPTDAMTQAGARAGHVPARAVKLVYQAMVSTAQH